MKAGRQPSTATRKPTTPTAPIASRSRTPRSRSASETLRHPEVEALTEDVARLNEVHEKGRRAVRILSDRAARFVNDWEKVIARTGLDAEEFVAASGDGPEASGGPFLLWKTHQNPLS